MARGKGGAYFNTQTTTWHQELLKQSMSTRQLNTCPGVWLKHYAVNQKLTQHCRLTILQFKKLTKKEITKHLLRKLHSFAFVLLTPGPNSIRLLPWWHGSIHPEIISDPLKEKMPKLLWKSDSNVIFEPGLVQIPYFVVEDNLFEHVRGRCIMQFSSLGHPLCSWHWKRCYILYHYSLVLEI